MKRDERGPLLHSIPRGLFSGSFFSLEFICPSRLRGDAGGGGSGLGRGGGTGVDGEAPRTGGRRAPPGASVRQRAINRADNQRAAGTACLPPALPLSLSLSISSLPPYDGVKGRHKRQLWKQGGARALRRRQTKVAVGFHFYPPECAANKCSNVFRGKI